MIRIILAFFAALLGMSVLAPLLAIGMPLVGIAWLTMRGGRVLEPEVKRWPELFEFDSVLGWRAKGNLDCHVLEERGDVFHVKTDRHGWAGTRTIDECDMVVVGDSHAWGYGTDHHKTFSRRCKSVAIKTVGVPGYNLVQELLLMRQIAPQLKGKLVVWFVFVGNDLADNISPEADGYRVPFVRQAACAGGWEIVTRHLSPSKWRVSEALKFRRHYAVLPALHCETPFSQRAYAACEYLIRAGADICREVEATLVVMVVPAVVALSRSRMDQLCKARAFKDPVDPDYPDRTIREICSRAGVHFATLKGHLTADHYYDRDEHWTAEGHEIVARVLESQYAMHRLGNAASR